MDNYIFVFDRDGFDEFLVTLGRNDLVVVDTETNTLSPYVDPEAMIGFSVWFPDEGCGYYLPFRHGYKPNAMEPDNINPGSNLPVEWLSEVSFAGKHMVGYNTLFDLGVLYADGIDSPDTSEDVWQGAFMANENERLSGGNYQLKELSRKYLKDETVGEEILHRQLKKLGYGSTTKGSPRHFKANMWRLSSEETAYYAIDDVRLTWELREFYRPILESWLMWDLYMERNDYYHRVVFRMEKYGIPASFEVINSQMMESADRANEIHQKIIDYLGWVPEQDWSAVYKALPFNPNSATSVKRLFEFMDVPITSTGMKEMRRLAEGNPIASSIVQWRELMKAGEYREALELQLTLQSIAEDYQVVEPAGNLETALLKQRINIGSPDQLKAMFIRQDTPVQSTAKATLEVMEKQGNELAGLVLEWRRWDKAISTFYKPWLSNMDADGHIHANFRNLTVTGRPNSYEPNMLQTPRKGRYDVKKALIAPPGWLIVEADYKSQELFVAAHFAQCEAMARLVSEGQDLHWYTTENMDVRGILYPGMSDEKILKLLGIKHIAEMGADERREKVNKALRQVGKILNFAVMYGSGAAAISKLLNVNRTQAKKLIDAWFDVFPEMRKLQEDLTKIAMSGRHRDDSPDGTFYYHRNPDGLVRHFNTYIRLKQSPPLHVILNVLIQGHSATVTRRAMLRCVDEWPDNSVFIPILNLYDAIYFLVREDKVDEVLPKVQHFMTDFEIEPKLQVEFEVGDNWYDKAHWEVAA